MKMSTYKEAASPTAIYAGIALLILSFVAGIKTGQYPPEYMIISVVGLMGVRMGARAYQNGKKADNGKDFS